MKETTPLLNTVTPRRNRAFSVGTEVYCRGEGIGKISELEAGSSMVVKFDDGTQGSFYPSQVTPLSKRKRTNSTPKLHFLQVTPDSTLRSITSNGAIFNLVSTIVGGGVLSLPYAFSKCGLILGMCALFFSCLISGFSIDLLVAASRGVGRNSYATVVQKAFGTNAQAITGGLIMTLTWLCAVAYIVLVGDLLTPIFEFFFTVDIWGRRVISSLAIACVAPMCYQRSLSSLSALSTLCIISILIVSLAISHHSITKFGKTHKIFTSQESGQLSFSITPNIRYFPENWFDALNVFPVFGVCFLCHFNVLPIHTELQMPTRNHMRLVVKWTMFITSTLYFLVGVLGYFWSFSETCGNVLLNFPPDDILISIGRVCLSLTLLFSFPLLILPCRNALHNLITITSPPIYADGGAGAISKSTRIYVYHESPANELLQYDSFIMKDKTVIKEQPLSTERLVVLTSLVLLTAVTTGCFLSSVLVIWTIMGATVSFTIAYILPSLVYLKLRSKQGGKYYVGGAKLLLGFSILASIACTITVVYNLNPAPCPAVDKTRFVEDVFF